MDGRTARAIGTPLLNGDRMAGPTRGTRTIGPQTTRTAPPTWRLRAAHRQLRRPRLQTGLASPPRPEIARSPLLRVPPLNLSLKTSRPAMRPVAHGVPPVLRSNAASSHPPPNPACVSSARCARKRPAKRPAAAPRLLRPQPHPPPPPPPLPPRPRRPRAPWIRSLPRWLPFKPNRLRWQKQFLLWSPARLQRRPALPAADPRRRPPPPPPPATPADAAPARRGANHPEPPATTRPPRASGAAPPPSSKDEPSFAATAARSPFRSSPTTTCPVPAALR